MMTATAWAAKRDRLIAAHMAMPRNYPHAATTGAAPDGFNALWRARGDDTWFDRYVPSDTARAAWAWLYRLARRERNNLAFAIARPDGTYWEVL